MKTFQVRWDIQILLYRVSAVFHFSHSKWHLALQKGRCSLVFYRIDRIIYLQISAIFRPRRRNSAAGERVVACRAVHR